MDQASSTSITGLSFIMASRSTEKQNRFHPDPVENRRPESYNDPVPDNAAVIDQKRQAAGVFFIVKEGALMYDPHLETFLRVADAGSFSKAAEELYITPSAVIKQINLLESRLGM